ncbi:Cro/Cl family transcriptional regulator [Hafnia alvei]|uniref:phage repressor protein CI n=1 Tax=Hafnia alvei TaxID=569 RepID=UPI000DAAEC3E|nr:phage repressor protein CI [Hafnia alvei]AWV44576.1 Cro/Cl family transcriptional regulator [Hafnia alvei]
MKFQGGESAVQRLMQAYGFTMKKQLGDHLGAGTGTISTWVKRDYFPGEAIVRCALETGVSLEWLASGVGEPIKSGKERSEDGTLICIKVQKLVDGVLIDAGELVTNAKGILVKPKRPLFIELKDTSYLVEIDFCSVAEGYWLMSRGEFISIENIVLLPGNCFFINGVSWPREEVVLLGKVVSKTIIL